MACLKPISHLPISWPRYWLLIVIVKLHFSDTHDRVTSVVYDEFMHFAQAVANNLKLPGINVRTSAAATLLLFAVFPDAHHEKGYISFPGTCEFESFNFGVDNSLGESTLIKFFN